MTSMKPNGGKKCDTVAPAAHIKMWCFIVKSANWRLHIKMRFLPGGEYTPTYIPQLHCPVYGGVKTGLGFFTTFAIDSGGSRLQDG
jgi:hypothetical protein